jgi:hypothetical protein
MSPTVIANSPTFCIRFSQRNRRSHQPCGRSYGGLHRRYRSSVDPVFISRTALLPKLRSPIVARTAEVPGWIRPLPFSGRPSEPANNAALRYEAFWLLTRDSEFDPVCCASETKFAELENTKPDFIEPSADLRCSGLEFVGSLTLYGAKARFIDIAAPSPMKFPKIERRVDGQLIRWRSGVSSA